MLHLLFLHPVVKMKNNQHHPPFGQQEMQLLLDFVVEIEDRPTQLFSGFLKLTK